MSAERIEHGALEPRSVDLGVQRFMERNLNDRVEFHMAHRYTAFDDWRVGGGTDEASLRVFEEGDVVKDTSDYCAVHAHSGTDTINGIPVRKIYKNRDSLTGN